MTIRTTSGLQWKVNIVRLCCEKAGQLLLLFALLRTEYNMSAHGSCSRDIFYLNRKCFSLPGKHALAPACARCLCLFPSFLITTA
jgi:hypothetical protein